MAKSKTRSRAGQALSEYTLVGVLIGIVCITGMVALGNALNNTLHNLFLSTRPTSPIALRAPAQSPHLPEPLPDSIPLPAPPTTEMMSGISFTTANGRNISLPDYPEPISKSIKVIGANGATSILSDTINSVAKQLLDAGEIDTAQYNDLVALANQGHRLGNLEKALEDAAAQATSSADYASMKISFDGKTYNPKKLSDAQGFDTNSQDASKVKDPLDTRSSLGETEKFLKLYDKATKSGALSDPAVQQVVADLASQITYLSEAAVSNTYKAANGDISPEDIRNNIVSDMTHADSLGICQAGKGKDRGMQCAL